MFKLAISTVALAAIHAAPIADPRVHSQHLRCFFGSACPGCYQGLRFTANGIFPNSQFTALGFSYTTGSPDLTFAAGSARVFGPATGQNQAPGCPEEPPAQPVQPSPCPEQPVQPVEPSPCPEQPVQPVEPSPCPEQPVQLSPCPEQLVQPSPCPEQPVQPSPCPEQPVQPVEPSPCSEQLMQSVEPSPCPEQPVQPTQPCDQAQSQDCTGSPSFNFSNSQNSNVGVTNYQEETTFVVHKSAEATNASVDSNVQLNYSG